MNAKIARHQALAAFLVFVGGLCCLKAQSPTPKEEPFPVSLIRWIASPEKFDGQRVRVIGVLGYGGGLDQAVCLYISEADARNAVMTNCISVVQSFDKEDKRIAKYVILNATFHYIGRHGIDSLFFDHITDVGLWPPPAGKQK